MSKKINIAIPNKVKPNLIDLFHEYLSRKSREPKISEPYLWDEDEYEDMAAYWDKVFPGWDDGLDNDVIYPPKNNSVLVLKPKKDKRNKDGDVYNAFWQDEREENWKCKNKHKKNKRARLVDINVPYSGNEDDNFVTEDYEPSHKEIWFYLDYHNKEDKLEFNSLKEFSDYCDSMGYWIDKEVISDITWRYESHCCLNPESEKIGLLEIMSSHSYGEMFYDACEECELGD